MKFIFKLLLFSFVSVTLIKCSDSTPQTIPYTIFEKDSTSRQMTFRIQIEDRTIKDSLIEICRQLKAEREWQEKLVCFFYINPSSIAAWASVAYLPHCDNCETDKDIDGKSVQYSLIGITKSFADSLNGLKMDSIENKNEIISFIDDTWKCKTIFYATDSDTSKLVFAQLFIDGGKIVKEYPAKIVGGQKRFYDRDSDKDYIILNAETNQLEYVGASGKVWQSIDL